jgi:hypothetical protein
MFTITIALIIVTLIFDELEGQYWAEQYEFDYAEERAHYAKLKAKYGDEAEYYTNKYGLFYAS